MVPDAGFVDGILCNIQTTSLCMSGDDGSGGLITSRHYTSGSAAQDMFVTQSTSICGAGKVTETCPFVIGSGLNNHFDSQPIVFIGNFENQMLYYADPNSGDNLREGSRGDEFVLSADLSGADAGSQLVDVEVTNALPANTTPWGACTTGLGNAVSVDVLSGAGNPCVWTKQPS